MAHRTRTPEEIERSMKAARDLKAKQTLKEQKNNIRYAQYALMAIGIIQLLVVAAMFDRGYTVVVLSADIFIGLMFIGLYFLSREKPALAFRIGVIAYAVIQVLLVVIDARNLVSGILIKIIIFMTLFAGIAALKRIPKSMMDKKDTGVLDDIEKEL